MAHCRVEGPRTWCVCLAYKALDHTRKPLLTRGALPQRLLECIIAEITAFCQIPSPINRFQEVPGDADAAGLTTGDGDAAAGEALGTGVRVAAGVPEGVGTTVMLVGEGDAVSVGTGVSVGSGVSVGVGVEVDRSSTGISRFW